jgi:PAS domain S-box-containing protein
MIGRYFRHSLRAKLLLVVAVTALLALVIAGAALVTYDLRTYKQSRITDLSTLGDVLAAAAAPAMAFKDTREANASLATLRVRPAILAGALRDVDGQVFASYSPNDLGPPALLAAAQGGHAIAGARIALVKPVFEKGERVGTLYLVARYEATQRLLDTATIVGLVLAFSLAGAIAGSFWLQRSFIKPLLDMTDASRRVMGERDFSVRVEKTTEDEVGYLVDTFNAMVDEVGRRSHELTESNRELTREVAERKAAEDALRESESRFREMADHVPVLIWINEEHGCVFVNSEYIKFTGRRLEQIAGMGWTDIVHPDDLQQYADRYRDAVSRRVPFEAEVRLRRVDGRYRWLKSVATPRMRADGSLIHYVGCSFDINAIKEYITELDLAEQALRDADRRKDEFLAMLSHELRNPLNPIRNAAAILQFGAEPSEVAWAAEVIERQSQQLSRLLEDLMDAARITQGKLEVRRQRVSVRQIVDAAMETTRALFRTNRQDVEIDVPAGDIYLDADPARMAQVLGNILNNAAKYTPAGGRIRLAVKGQAGRVTISVKDSGSGIAPADLPHVFDLFMQSKTHTAHAAGGLGIGLALVRVLVQMHGGTVEARSEGLGKGSEFIITMPEMVETRAAMMDRGPMPLPVSGRRLRVLVADDVQDSVDTLARLLRALKHDVHVAHDGSEALELARRIQPDAAVLDIGMPGLTGYEVATRIRRQDWGKKITLIALTGWGQNSDLARSQQAGFDHHMTKPADAVLLAHYLAQAASGPRIS